MKPRIPLSARRLQLERGAVTITYLYPGTVVPPPVPAPLPQNTVIATVSASAAADTSAVITHMFGLANSEITQGFPQVSIIAQDGNEITSPWWESSESGNYTVLQKGTTAAGGLAKVYIQRPHSIVR
jgi:hypothetical protein